ncbi:ABC transporter ATP-binding protein [Paenibacillus sp. CAA11]|uniref:ABC transporter ATP-binding protein n=1 Tax=Paenibacillus sp. CAA11 TaxID=1532905 RepID=UPI001F39FA66|nr:energy-coupling factor transporter ATPase [Paenibacillus sp. CAA11]
MDASLVLKRITYTYESEEAPALQDLSLVVRPGEWVAIAGRNGSGKSTLCGLMTGYLPRIAGGKREGVLQVGGVDPAEADIADLAVRVGMVFQDPDAQLVQGVVQDEVAFGPENLCVSPQEIEQRLQLALRDVQLEQQRASKVRELSGGQRQRTAIAAVLSMETPILIFDEPAASLDKSARQRLIAVLRRLHGEGRTVLTVSARLDEIAGAAERLVVLERGRVALDGKAEQLLKEQRPRLQQLGVLPAGPPSVAGGGTNRSIGQAASSSAAPAASGREPLLELRQLSFRYPGGQQQALRDVSLSLRPGSWTLLCGENGSGKTTLSRLLMGLLPLPKGSVYWDGQDAARLGTDRLAGEIGYVFQEPDDQFVAGTVLEEMLYGPLASRQRRRFARRRKEVPGAELEALKTRALLLLHSAGLAGKENASPYLLSGGEKRLLSAAAQFMVPKRLYILDEPTSGTDYAACGLMKQLCLQAIEKGAALLMITHEPEQFAAAADTVITLDQGRVLKCKSHGL